MNSQVKGGSKGAAMIVEELGANQLITKICVVRDRSAPEPILHEAPHLGTFVGVERGFTALQARTIGLTAELNRVVRDTKNAERIDYACADTASVNENAIDAVGLNGLSHPRGDDVPPRDTAVCGLQTDYWDRPSIAALTEEQHSVIAAKPSNINTKDQGVDQ